MLPKYVTLDQLAQGQRAKIKKVGSNGLLRRRLLDMGFTKGAAIKMIRAAPLGDPIEYQLRGYFLFLRKAEARTIEVEL